MKFVISTLSEVAEPLRGEYEERGGKFYLKTEGDYEPLATVNTKLAEFRDNNRTLNARVTELTEAAKKLEGIDPVEYAKLKTKITELEATGAKDKDSVAELIKKAVTDAITPLKTENEARKASEATALAAAAQSNLRGLLREAGVKAGVDERALPDYIRRGEEVFRNVDGKVVPRNGDAPIFSKKNVTEELSMEEWAVGLQADAPFLFKTSRGTGANPGGNGNGGYQGERRTISSDPLEFGRNLEDIAAGKVIVQQ